MKLRVITQPAGGAGTDSYGFSVIVEDMETGQIIPCVMADILTRPAPPDLAGIRITGLPL